MAGIWSEIQQLDSQKSSKVILKENEDFHVTIIGKPTYDEQQRFVMKESWNVQHLLPSPWDLDPERRWEVALTELCIPKTFQMYPDACNPLTFTFSSGGQKLHEYILTEHNFYHSPEELIQHMTSMMEDSESIDFPSDDMEEEEDTVETLRLIDLVQFYYDPRTLRVLLRIKIPPPSDLTLTFSEGLADLLNAETEYVIKAVSNIGSIQRVVFNQMFNFHLVTDYIHILLQEVNKTFVNEQMVPWLYSCSIHPSDMVSHSHTHITVTPKYPFYVPLSNETSMRDTLHLAVVDNNMNVLKPHRKVYMHNDTVFHLHFRHIIPGR